MLALSKKFLFSLVGSAVLLPLMISPVNADSFSGKLIDLACYLPQGDKAHGERHYKCSLRCAQGGMPMGLLTDSGKVYLLFPDHDDTTAYHQAKTMMHQSVNITGFAVERSGMNAISIRKIKL